MSDLSIQKKTVTVGIPAYNEEENIENALLSVLRQTGPSFVLDKVIVVSDGSSDKTEEVVEKMRSLYPIIKLVADQERKGKITRMNQMCRMNESDFLLFFDADIVFEGTGDIEEMVKQFGDDEAVKVVASHDMPVKAETFVERINNAGYRLWDETRLFVNNGNHIHNLHGSCSLIRREFGKTLEFPVELTTDASYLYLKAIEKDRRGFRYAHTAHVLHHSPDNLFECRLQGTRAIMGEKKHVALYFGPWVYDEFRIPTKNKVRAVAKMMLLSPFLTVLSVLLGVYVRLSPVTDEEAKKHRWKIVTSTKRSLKDAEPQYKMKSVYNH